MDDGGVAVLVEGYKVRVVNPYMILFEVALGSVFSEQIPHHDCRLTRVLGRPQRNYNLVAGPVIGPHALDVRKLILGILLSRELKIRLVSVELTLAQLVEGDCIYAVNGPEDKTFHIYADTLDLGFVGVFYFILVLAALHVCLSLYQGIAEPLRLNDGYESFV